MKIKTTKTINIPALLLSVFCMVSCEYNVEEEDMEEVSCDPDISFSAGIRPIIDNNCIQCHNGSVHPLDFRNFTTVQNNAAKIRELTEARIMPAGGGSLTSEEIAMIGCWVDNGAQDN